MIPQQLLGKNFCDVAPEISGHYTHEKPAVGCGNSATIRISMTFTCWRIAAAIAYAVQQADSLCGKYECLGEVRIRGCCFLLR